jgi:tellurite methyltransferase
MNKSIQFFDTQFQQQIELEDFVLNPFERAVLPFIQGRVVDLGCGLGNLSMAAANQCSSILALDASPAAVDALNLRARAANVPIVAQVADLAAYELEEHFDTVLSIGLLMFFPPSMAASWIDRIKSNTRKNGIAAINVLIDGTTFLDMFQEGSYTLFAEDALHDAFREWQVEYTAIEEFSAPKGTLKRFATIVARNI